MYGIWLNGCLYQIVFTHEQSVLKKQFIFLTSNVLKQLRCTTSPFFPSPSISSWHCQNWKLMTCVCCCFDQRHSLMMSHQLLVVVWRPPWRCRLTQWWRWNWTTLTSELKERLPVWVPLALQWGRWLAFWPQPWHYWVGSCSDDGELQAAWSVLTCMDMVMSISGYKFSVFAFPRGYKF